MSSFLKKTLKADLGKGGAYIADDDGADNLHTVLKAMIQARGWAVRNGLLAGAPTTPSAQLTGTGNTSWRVNVAEGVVKVAGKAQDLAAAVDVVIHSNSQLLVNGQSCVAALVAKKAADGTISMIPVKGTVATTAAQVGPTDAVIQAAVGAGLDWVKLAEVSLNRTGDTTVTESYDNSKADFGDDGVTVE